jgi:hypothetical protein
MDNLESFDWSDTVELEYLDLFEKFDGEDFLSEELRSPESSLYLPLLGTFLEGVPDRLVLFRTSSLLLLSVFSDFSSFTWSVELLLPNRVYLSFGIFRVAELDLSRLTLLFDTPSKARKIRKD